MPTLPRVLVLEDEPLIAVMMRDWLTELGCETVGPAHTVHDALALILAAAPNGAILDVSLGDQDCTPVAEILREHGVPFAFATGHAVDGLTAIYAQALTLSKPYDFEAVRDVVTKLLNGHDSP
jgi:DNA-binding response OmpR family regulator